MTSRFNRRFVPKMKNLLLGAVLLLAFACGAYHFPGESPAPAAGTVSGRVLAVPCAPVEKPGTSCAGRPVPNLEIDYFDGTSVTERTFTDAAGHYSIALKPATYAVKMKTYMRVISGPLKLEVGAGSTTVADYLLDSGIRVPVPQQ